MDPFPPATISLPMSSCLVYLKSLSGNDLCCDICTVICVAQTSPQKIGPTTWSSPDSGFTPEVTREVVLHRNIAPGGLTLPGKRIAKLLPSGRLVLFIDQRNFDYIEIVDVNLSKGTHEIILIARAPDTDVDDPFKYPVLWGSLAAVDAGSKGDQFLVIDCTQRSALVVQCHQRPQAPSPSRLIPGHIVLTTFSIKNRNRSEIHLISTHTLGPHWIPATPPDGVGEFNLKLSTIPGPDMHADVWHNFDQISVWPKPLQDGTYRLWISESLWAAARDPSLRCYKLSPSDGGHLQLSQRARYSAYRKDLYRSITYSGHTLRTPWGEPDAKIISSTSGADVGDIPLTDSRDHVHLSPFSGALTYVSETSVIVRYYK
ncbi:hypothetical protein B0H11DRAFT_1950265 [Mycena galericulata]|nr:hypothetical protein B0H11DRAFT_1950265 [Mycena galericulata]